MRMRFVLVLLSAMVGVLGAALLVLSFPFLTGQIVGDSDIPEQSESAIADERGFIAYCDVDSCVTLPTLIERNGETWQLGYYPDYYNDATPELSYRDTTGNFMTVDAAFE